MTQLTQFVGKETLFIVSPKESQKIFRESYNRASFLFEHTLHSHPLFELRHLAEAAHKLAKIPGRLYYNVGDLEIGRRWDLSTERPFSFDEALDRVDSAGAWMILKGAQALPEYEELLSSLLAQFFDLSGQKGGTRLHNISIIITSPKRITPYHIDADCNYLLQISGSKTAYVFNGFDPEVLKTEELERFYAGDINAAEYRDSCQSKAVAYELKPGNGVHVPVSFPHWVQNHDNVSISASINFCFTDRTVPDIYRINHKLRKLGLSPSRAGSSRVADMAKGGLARVLRLAMSRKVE